MVAWFVQVKYAVSVDGAAPDGWVTVAVAEDMRAAARHAAFVYRDREHPDDGIPNQLRIRQEAQLRADGLSAVAEATESLCAFGERTAETQAPAAGNPDADGYPDRR